jgi:hypothetical protein
MSHTKEELNKLSLVEIKLLCKQYRLARTGTKGNLIKSILDLEKPTPVTINIPTEYKPPKGKKVIGVKSGDQEKLIQVGKLREKNKVQNLYYSMGVHYFLVDKEFQFI